MDRKDSTQKVTYVVGPRARSVSVPSNVSLITKPCSTCGEMVYTDEKSIALGGKKSVFVCVECCGREVRVAGLTEEQLREKIVVSRVGDESEIDSAEEEQIVDKIVDRLKSSASDFASLDPKVTKMLKEAVAKARIPLADFLLMGGLYAFLIRKNALPHPSINVETLEELADGLVDVIKKNKKSLDREVVFAVVAMFEFYIAASGCGFSSARAKILRDMGQDLLAILSKKVGKPDEWTLDFEKASLIRVKVDQKDGAA